MIRETFPLYSALIRKRNNLKVCTKTASLLPLVPPPQKKTNKCILFAKFKILFILGVSDWVFFTKFLKEKIGFPNR